jgi:hypothetical protein
LATPPLTPQRVLNALPTAPTVRAELGSVEPQGFCVAHRPAEREIEVVLLTRGGEGALERKVRGLSVSGGSGAGGNGQRNRHGCAMTTRGTSTDDHSLLPLYDLDRQQRPILAGKGPQRRKCINCDASRHTAAATSQADAEQCGDPRSCRLRYGRNRGEHQILITGGKVPTINHPSQSR